MFIRGLTQIPRVIRTTTRTYSHMIQVELTEFNHLRDQNNYLLKQNERMKTELDQLDKVAKPFAEWYKQHESTYGKLDFIKRNMSKIGDELKEKPDPGISKLDKLARKLKIKRVIDDSEILEMFPEYDFYSFFGSEQARWLTTIHTVIKSIPGMKESIMYKYHGEIYVYRPDIKQILYHPLIKNDNITENDFKWCLEQILRFYKDGWVNIMRKAVNNYTYEHYEIPDEILWSGNAQLNMKLQEDINKKLNSKL